VQRRQTIPIVTTPHRTSSLRRLATVDSILAESMQVILDPDPGCASCHRGQGCGAGLLQLWFRERPRSLSIARVSGVAAGDRIALNIPASTLLKLAFVAYCLPLIFLLLMASLFQLVFPGIALLAVAGGILGLVLGFMAYPVLSHRVIYSDPGATQVLQIELNPSEFAAS